MPRADFDLLCRWFWIGFTLRMVLMLVIHFSGADVSLRLTKDAFLYDRTGRAMAEYWRTDGLTEWPARVDNVYWDCAYEWFCGFSYYALGDSPLLGKCLSVLSGAVTPLVFWQIALLVYRDRALARRVLMWTALFPSHVYYSCHLVRDAHAVLAVALVLLGMVSLTRPTSRMVQLALPVGLFLVAGFRFYMFFALLVLIPTAICITWLFVPGRRLHYALRVIFACLIVVAAGALLNLDALIEKFAASDVVDLDVLNHIRQKMNRGSGAMFRGSDVPQLGFNNPEETSKGILIGLYYFFISVDPTNMGSIRQWLAVPEVIIVLIMLPFVFRGMQNTVQSRSDAGLNIMLVTLGITLLYSTFATNAGPLMRWRLQTAGVYVMWAALGWELVYGRRLFRVKRIRQRENSVEADVEGASP